jgi:preprotein translocase subunit YajC
MATAGDYVFLGICVFLALAIWQGLTRGSPAVQEQMKKQQDALKVGDQIAASSPMRSKEKKLCWPSDLLQ